jgi:hypothetical protein
VKPEPEDEQQQDEQQQQQQDSEQQLQLQVPPYSCPGCCRKLAEESRMDLLHLHAVLLADMRPAKPRAAAEIFAAEFARKVWHVLDDNQHQMRKGFSGLCVGRDNVVLLRVGAVLLLVKPLWVLRLKQLWVWLANLAG